METTMRTERILSNILLIIISGTLALLVLEMATQAYLMNFASEDVFVKYASANQLQERYGKEWVSKGAHIPHRYLGFYPHPNYQRGLNRHNSLGFRGDEVTVEKPESIYRIVALGGSTTYSDGVKDYKKSYPYLLQESLRNKGFNNVEVINAGENSYSSWESVINLQFRVLDLNPDLIIIYHGINDAHVRIVWPPSAYRGDNSGTKMVKVQNIKMPSIWEYSTFLRYILIKLGLTEPHSSLNQLIGKSPTNYGRLFTEQQKRGIYPQGIFKEVSAMTMLENNPPVYFERNLNNIVTIAHANGIEVVLATFANSPLFTERPKASSEEYIMALDENNEVTRKFKSKAYVFDFAGVMPKDKKYFTDGIHFTALGNKKRAELFGEYLIENNLINVTFNDTSS